MKLKFVVLLIGTLLSGINSTSAQNGEDQPNGRRMPFDFGGILGGLAGGAMAQMNAGFGLNAGIGGGAGAGGAGGAAAGGRQ